ncbi:MAG TPA: NAD(P)/FAD-dependent oxidoreductase [Chthoniobacterales bacterium]|jgi:NADH dehydrogenase
MDKKKVIIIGGGFAGLAAAKGLGHKNVEVVLVDRTNHHLFQPLLYQVATGGLSPANIAQPLRFVLREYENVRVVWAEITSIDVNQKTVTSQEGMFPFDYLVVATGARHSYFGHPEWEQFAPGLKTLEDAVEIRRRIFTAFEVAEKAQTAEERQAALTFVVIGGGPTGVEMAGAIGELSRQALKRDFRRIDPSVSRVILIDASTRILSSFDEDLAASAYDDLAELGVDVRTEQKVSNIDATGVTVGDEHIQANTIIWAAGNAASPLAKMLGEVDRPGRVMVQADLSIAGHPEIFALGDMAHLADAKGQPLPGVSPVAIQMGEHAAKNILALMRGEATKPFHYHDKGSMATIGRNRAVADLHWIKFTGFIAWLAWLFVHLAFLVGLRNQFLVFAQWIYSYVTFGKAARLITNSFKPAVPPPAPAASVPPAQA